MLGEDLRYQLNDYFKAELDELRKGAIDFAKDYPNLAEELALNGGKSRDPHIELLIQSFAWMTSRLRQNMESEVAKLPTMLLQQLYPQLVSSVPSMAIMQCDVDGFAANFEHGYQLNASMLMEPLSNPDIRKPELKKLLSKCRFSTCHPVTLWPLKVTDVQKHPINTMPNIERSFHNGQSLLEIRIAETQAGAAEGLALSRPLRFYINLDEQHKFSFYDFSVRHCCGIAVVDQQGNIVSTLAKEHFSQCGFSDAERIFPTSLHQDLSFSLLQDYFCFADKFMFFEISGLEQLYMQQDLRLILVFDEILPRPLRLTSDSLKLNCVPVINLYTKTSEPIPLTHKHYRYKLYASREGYECHEVYRVNKVFSVNRNGETREFLPYFALDRRDEVGSGYRWMQHTQASHRKDVAGTESWLSVYNSALLKDLPLGETLYAQTLTGNRNACELFPPGQGFSLVGSSPVAKAILLNKPTRYRGKRQNNQQLWQLLSHLSLYYVSLSQPALAQDTLITLLGLYAQKEDAVSQRQIESIEAFTAKPDVHPVIQNGWRGYYKGTKFTLTLNERKFDGRSAILFAEVIYHFLALFSHINAYVCLELYLGNRSIYQWKPLAGHKVLA